jgi:hypothetical protein
MRMHRLVGVAAMALGLLGCGKEIGRLPMIKEESVERKLTVHASKPIVVWVALDWQYTEPLEARYDIELVQNASVVAKAQCNPLDVSVKTNSREVTIGSSRNVKYTGKMKECELKPAQDGEATVKARLVFPKKTGSPVIRDASLVLKE